MTTPSPDIQTDEAGNVTIHAPTVIMYAQAPLPGEEPADEEDAG